MQNLYFKLYNTECKRSQMSNSRTCNSESLNKERQFWYFKSMGVQEEKMCPGRIYLEFDIHFLPPQAPPVPIALQAFY